MESKQQDNSTAESGNRHPATVISWLALAAAFLIAAFIIRNAIEPGDLKPGGDTTGLPAIGTMAPDFTTRNAQGQEVSLSDFAGQPLWLNFWGSWCPPCRAEIPDMIQAYNRVKDDGVVLVAVSLEEPSDDAFEYANRLGMDFVVLSDPDKKAISNKYRVRSFPTHLFIDKNGIVRDISVTPMSTQTAIQKAKRIS